MDTKTNKAAATKTAKSTTAKSTAKKTAAKTAKTTTAKTEAPVDAKQTPVAEPVPSGDPVRQKYLVSGQYDHVNFGGLPMPAGVYFNGYECCVLTEKKAGEGITEKQALAAITRKLTAKNKRRILNLKITAVSLLPPNWKK